MAKVTEAYLEARREEILDAAIACFARNGFHQTTMADIAREAGISPGAIYRYFASKEDVIKASGEARSEVRAELYRQLAKEPNTLQALDMLVDGYMARLQGHDPEIPLFVQLFGEGQSNPAVRESVLARWNDSFAEIAPLISLAQAKGDINASLKPSAVALLLVATIGGLMVHKTLDPTVNVSEFAQVLKALYKGDFWRANGHATDGDSQHPVGLQSQTQGGSHGSPAKSG